MTRCIRKDKLCKYYLQTKNIYIRILCKIIQKSFAWKHHVIFSLLCLTQEKKSDPTFTKKDAKYVQS